MIHFGIKYLFKYISCGVVKQLWFVGVCWKLSLENCQVGGGGRIQIGRSGFHMCVFVWFWFGDIFNFKL